MRRPLLAASAVALTVVPAAALAAPATYTARTVKQTTGGLPLGAPLEGNLAVTQARIVVPAKDWKARKGATEGLRFTRTRGACTYDIVVLAGSELSSKGPAADFVSAKLPPPSGSRIDSGGRGQTSAFRVVKRSGTGSTAKVEGLWAGVLTLREDVARDGKAARALVTVTATQRKGTKCNAFTWREVVGPEIADALAATSARLNFREAEDG